MEILAGTFMILLGVGIAAIVFVAIAIGSRNRQESAPRVNAAPNRDVIASSILLQLAELGGAPPARASEIVREIAGAAVGTRDVDITSWAEAYKRASTPDQREWLLDAAVQTAMKTGGSFPLHQYNALVDLSFALGFQTDALARLRSRYNFSFEDYAKRNRPRSADRGATNAPLFERKPVADPARLLARLELKGEVTRHEVISAYRRLAAKHHPDRFHDADPEAQREAAIRFMELTEAYEKLLLEFPEA